MKLKKKMVAGVVAVGIISGAGFSLANTDAGGALRSWYDNLFNQTSEEVLAESNANFERILAQLRAENEVLKELATSQINGTRDSAIANSTLAINSAKESHIQSLDAEKAAIELGMEYQFYNLFLSGSLEILAKGNEMQGTAVADFGNHTGAKGQEAVTEVTNQLNTVKENAVSELESAIIRAKEELTADVDDYTEIVSRNLNNQAVWKGEEIREELDRILAGMVAEQQAIITAKAAELEADAKQSLDDVVAGIGNE
ncbi:ElaB/YqjD/DUF883 family membrane-anchored ribosome-binding protein [Cytobacillus horneckiae]|uniref:Uncharacterized protein n=1 Tax=Cytobacillus horneckiae TaxID=549687 RepID=A0A2N0ZFI2_9BACI|nr:hypothetical protein [Cytobacillus horneckiae]NRG46462.1 hypothetical protein [Bacillus sp. CRN 9]MBN6885214.1 hypothetical protein [Cytobacillus horneckiae]MCM3179041.1 hypothetical protein [Cytobacillus horneckiae]MEC1154258.1 hypothetical protein [Cytobacillus horneckiae]MED2937594.1 hypothetical protein [Cytobacillus horneckiae]